MGQLGTNIYIAAPNPPWTLAEKSTMTQAVPHPLATTISKTAKINKNEGNEL